MPEAHINVFFTTKQTRMMYSTCYLVLTVYLQVLLLKTTIQVSNKLQIQFTGRLKQKYLLLTTIFDNEQKTGLLIEHFLSITAL